MNQKDYPQDDHPNVNIDITSLTQVHTELNQLIQQNTNLRMKYPDEPQKFYQTQQNIDIILQDLNQLTQQQLPIIIQSNIFSPLIKILTHPNIDLSIQVIDILYNILEQQPQDDKLFQIYFRWSVWLIDNSMIQGLIGVLVKFDQENNIGEYEAGFKILKLIEIFTNIHDSVYDLLAEDKQLFEYLANRIMPNFVVKHKIIDDNKYVSSDVLVSLLTNSQKSQHIFSQFSGIQVLLQTISSYQTNLPTNPDQKQFLNNLFSCLSVLLINYLLPQNKKTYYEMKGNYLMINFIRKKNQYSSVALKVIANSLNSLSKQEEISSINSLINDGGLKYLFAVLKGKGFRGEDIDEQKAIDENTLSIIYCMIRSATQVIKDRVQYKLIQNRYQNLQRFFQLRNEYNQNISSQNLKSQQQQQKQQTTNEYLSKLSDGLSIIQIIDKIILVILADYVRLKGKLKNLFEIYGIKYTMIEKTIKDHYKYIGAKEEKKFVEYLLANNLILLKKNMQFKQSSKIKQENNQVKQEKQ